MKKMFLFMISVALLLSAVGCSNVEEKPAEAPSDSVVEDNQSATESPSTPTILSVSDLEDVLDALDLTDASLTYHGDTDETYSANAAIRSESYIEALKNLTWKEYVPTSGLDKNNAYSYQLTTPDATITAVLGKRDTNGPLHLIADVGEGWFIHSYTDQAEQIKQNWLTYDIFASWHTEAGSALRYGGDGIPLTAEELDFFEEYTEGTWTEYNAEIGGYHSGATQISCFFTSRYSDPRDMDANAFLAYCPGEYGLTQEDEEEFLLVQKKVDWRVGADNHLATFDEFPAPCRRISRTYLNGILMKYAGITVEEMHTDWTKEAFYISETDCFYTFTSDFGPGTFYPYYGEKNGDIVTLWENPCEDASMLTLKKIGENWHILAHQPAIYHFTAEVVKYGNDALCVKVMDAGDSTLSIGDELYVSVRDGYDNYPIGCSVEVAYSGKVTVYDDGTSGPDKTIAVHRVY